MQAYDLNLAAAINKRASRKQSHFAPRGKDDQGCLGEIGGCFCRFLIRIS